MRHYKIVRKYTDPLTGHVTTQGSEISVPEGRGLRMIRTGLYEKLSEFEDGQAEPTLNVIEVDGTRRKHPVQRIRESGGR